MTYNSVHVSNTVNITSRPGIQVIDRDSTTQAKTRTGHSRWFVMSDTQDLAGIWEYDNRYFSKFSDNEGHVFLDDAIDEIVVATSSYTDTTEIEINDQLQSETVKQADCIINALDPDGEDAAFELVHNGVFVAYIWRKYDLYHLNGWMFDGDFPTPEAAACEWLQVALPSKYELALATACTIVADRQLLPDYI
jgi:hypothetical protein